MGYHLDKVILADNARPDVFAQRQECELSRAGGRRCVIVHDSSEAVPADVAEAIAMLAMEVAVLLCGPAHFTTALRLPSWIEVHQQFNGLSHYAAGGIVAFRLRGKGSAAARGDPWVRHGYHL